MHNLSYRQKQIYDFIDNFVRENRYSPSYNDIACGCGLGNSTVVAHINAMRKKCCVEWEDRIPRTLHVLPLRKQKY